MVLEILRILKRNKCNCLIFNKEKAVHINWDYKDCNLKSKDTALGSFSPYHLLDDCTISELHFMPETLKEFRSKFMHKMTKVDVSEKEILSA